RAARPRCKGGRSTSTTRRQLKAATAPTDSRTPSTALPVRSTSAARDTFDVTARPFAGASTRGRRIEPALRRGWGGRRGRCRRGGRGARRLARVADLVLLHLAVERRAIQPEDLRRL